MYSKEEARQLKREFWTAFGKSFPRKWLLYQTKIKACSFKFAANRKTAEVSLNFEMQDSALRQAYFEKILALENILKDEYLPQALLAERYFLDDGKEIAKVWVSLDGVSVFNKEKWQEIFEFFVKNMMAFEAFFNEYQDFIKDV